MKPAERSPAELRRAPGQRARELAAALGVERQAVNRCLSTALAGAVQRSVGTLAGAVGFLRSNGNLFSMAITRARGPLHVVGDRAGAASSGVDPLADLATDVTGSGAASGHESDPDAAPPGPDDPPVAKPERVSDRERVLYCALYAAGGVRPIPQYGVEPYDLGGCVAKVAPWMADVGATA